MEACKPSPSSQQFCCSGEEFAWQHKSSRNMFTCYASLRKREGASLARLQAAAALNANPKRSAGKRVCENRPICSGQEPLPYTPYEPNLP